MFHCVGPVIQGVAAIRKNPPPGGHPARLDSSSNSIQRNAMNRTRLRLVFCLALLGAAVGLGTRTPTSAFAPATAEAAGPAVTPKTEAPNEARALSHAFSNVAKALGPSVVRIEVEMGGGLGMGPHGPPQKMPNTEGENDGGGGDGNNTKAPPFFRHFSQLG